MNSINKTNYYLNIAGEVAKRSTCIRRKYGCVIVKNDEIVSTGYNGAPRGMDNCTDLNYCLRETLNVPKGDRYELCRAVHAEQNALLSCSRSQSIGSIMYIVGIEPNGTYSNSSPCKICAKMIINAGVVKVVGYINGEITNLTTDDLKKIVDYIDD